MSDLVLLSGGLDSTTLLAHVRDSAGMTIAVDYGQRHAKELNAATVIADYYGVPFAILDFTSWGRLLRGSSLTGPTGPLEGSATIVPNRNALLLMAAAGVAITHGCGRVLTAVHAGDRAVYPDCRPEFIDAANYTVGLATEERVTIEAPFSNLSKAEVAELALSLGVPVSLTWSCYEGGVLHCGHCGACQGRREALGVADPTVYQAVAA